MPFSVDLHVHSRYARATSRNANLVELTLSADSPFVGTPSGLVPFPDNCALVTILREDQDPRT